MRRCSSNTHSKTQINHHANQCNPNNVTYRAAQNNHSNQCNPNNGSYVSCRSVSANNKK